MGAYSVMYTSDDESYADADHSMEDMDPNIGRKIENDQIVEQEMDQNSDQYMTSKTQMHDDSMDPKSNQNTDPNMHEDSEHLDWKHPPLQASQCVNPTEDGANLDACKALLKCQQHKAESHEFQEVYGAPMYVVSAFLDLRLPGRESINVLGIAPGYVYQQPLRCKIFLKDTQGGYKTVGMQGRVSIRYEEIKGLAVHWKQVIFKCDMNELGISPEHVEYVSVTTTHSCQNVTNLLKVMHIGFPISQNASSNVPSFTNSPSQPADYKTLALCVPTMYNLPSKMAGPLVEFIELNRQLGYEKIFVYDVFNSSSAIHKVLQYYKDSGFIDIVKWKVPVPVLYTESFDFCLNDTTRPGCNMKDR